MGTKTRQLVPVLPRVAGLEHRRVLDARVDGIRIVQCWLEMPDALEFQRVRRAVVPQVLAGNAVVDELVADGVPGRAAVVRALQDLSEPAARLRGIQPVRVRRRSFEVVDLPASE